MISSILYKKNNFVDFSKNILYVFLWDNLALSVNKTNFNNTKTHTHYTHYHHNKWEITSAFTAFKNINTVSQMVLVSWKPHYTDSENFFVLHPLHSSRKWVSEVINPRDCSIRINLIFILFGWKNMNCSQSRVETVPIDALFKALWKYMYTRRRKTVRTKAVEQSYMKLTDTRTVLTHLSYGWLILYKIT